MAPGARSETAVASAPRAERSRRCSVVRTSDGYGVRDREIDAAEAMKTHYCGSARRRWAIPLAERLVRVVRGPFPCGSNSDWARIGANGASEGPRRHPGHSWAEEAQAGCALGTIAGKDGPAYHESIIWRCHLTGRRAAG